MEWISPNRFPQRNAKGLSDFLNYCKNIAQKKGKSQLVHIAMRIKHIDPLAVLQSIYENNARHFYIEHPSDDCAIAGAEAVLCASFAGKDRFQSVRKWSEATLENTIAIREEGLLPRGPHFFSGFTFFDESQTENPIFDPATVFIPRWQVQRFQGVYEAMANIVIHVNSNIQWITLKIWAAHQKFNRFSYDKVEPIKRKQEIQVEDCNGDWFKSAVEQGLRDIAAKKYDKIVLARTIDLKAKYALEPLEWLNRLREKYQRCFAFSFSNGKGYSFVGATPERLLKISNGKLETVSLAGSAPRGKNAREDAQFQHLLLTSEKDLREQRYVTDAILKRLQSLGIKVDSVKLEPQLLSLSNIHHLMTPILVDIPKRFHFLDIAAVLHPTPAVGGTPSEQAERGIKSIETVDRGLYAGVIGWFDSHGNGEAVVAIRSALISKKKAKLYAGSGIVLGSDPENEKQETDIKLSTLLNNLECVK